MFQQTIGIDRLHRRSWQWTIRCIREKYIQRWWYHNELRSKYERRLSKHIAKIFAWQSWRKTGQTSLALPLGQSIQIDSNDQMVYTLKTTISRHTNAFRVTYFISTIFWLFGKINCLLHFNCIINLHVNLCCCIFCTHTNSFGIRKFWRKKNWKNYSGSI